MSRSSSPRSNSLTYAYNSQGYLPFKNLAMQRLSKLLIDGSISARDFRLEVLRYLIYPKTLTHYPIHQRGWLAVLDKNLLKRMGDSGKLKALNDAIKSIESDTRLPPYERVGKIVAAIKEATGKQFIRNSAFRELMNSKFNEYTLSDHLDEIHSIDDALRILRAAAAPSKPMKMISTFPELFAASSIRRMLENRVSDEFIFGGATDSTLPAALTMTLRGLHPERLRSGAAKRDFDELMLGLVDKDSPTYEALLKISNLLPAPKLTVDTEKMAQFLQFTFDNQLGAEGIFKKPGFLEAAEMLLCDPKITNHSFRDWLMRHVDSQYGAPPREYIDGEPVDFTNGLLGIAGSLMSAIKDVPVQHANSYDSLILSLSDTYNGKTEKSRHPFVWAMNELLAVDSSQPNLSFQKECAKALHGVPISLYPSESRLVPVADSLHKKVESAVMDRFDLFIIDKGKKVPRMTAGSFIYGAPIIGHFPTYRKSHEPNPTTGTFGEDIDITTEYEAPKPLLLNERMMTPPVISYKEHRDRAIRFAYNPKTMPPEFKQRPLRFNAEQRHSMKPESMRWRDARSMVDGDDAITTLGAAFNIATNHTPLHRLLNNAKENEALRAPNKLASLVAAACRNGASAQAIDDVGNSLIHDVLAKGPSLPVETVIEAVIALVANGGHFVDKNHFRVSLMEMLPQDVRDELMPVALASITEQGIASAIGDALLTGEDPIEQAMLDGLNQGPQAHRKKADLAL